MPEMQEPLLEQAPDAKEGDVNAMLTPWQEINGIKEKYTIGASDNNSLNDSPDPGELEQGLPLRDNVAKGCPECGFSSLVSDRGELFCPECGYVSEDITFEDRDNFRNEAKEARCKVIRINTKGYLGKRVEKDYSQFSKMGFTRSGNNETQTPIKTFLKHSSLENPVYKDIAADEEFNFTLEDWKNRWAGYQLLLNKQIKREYSFSVSRSFGDKYAALEYDEEKWYQSFDPVAWRALMVLAYAHEKDAFADDLEEWGNIDAWRKCLLRVRTKAEETKGKEIRIKLIEYFLLHGERELPTPAINGLRLCIDLYAIKTLNQHFLKSDTELPEIFGIRAKDYNRNMDLIEYVL